ncbi:unnamed protein product [Discula destructiva]
MPPIEVAHIMYAMETSGTPSSKLLHASSSGTAKCNPTTSTSTPSGSEDMLRYSTDTQSLLKGTHPVMARCHGALLKWTYFADFFSPCQICHRTPSPLDLQFCRSGVHKAIESRMFR